MRKVSGVEFAFGKQSEKGGKNHYHERSSPDKTVGWMTDVGSVF